MTLIGYRASNHPQQVAKRDAQDEVDDRATTSELFDPLNTRFGFTIDVAAAAHNAKCDRFYDRVSDGLRQSWAGETVWCNPPYSDIAPWVAKAWEELPWVGGGIVMLLPNNRGEQAWWQEMVEPHRDRFDTPLRTEYLPKRQRFIKRGQTEVGPNERPPFGLVLLIWRRHD